METRPEKNDRIAGTAQASAEYQDHLHAIAAHIPGVIYSYDRHPDGHRTTVYLGPGLDDLIGEAGSELASANIDALFDRVHPDDHELIKQAVVRGPQEGCRIDSEVRLLHDDGQYRWCRSLCNSVVRDGGIVRWFVVLIDIGEQKSIEERSRLLIDMAPSGIFFGCDGRIEFANRAFARMIGCDNPDDLIGRRVFDFIRPDYHDEILERVRAYDEGRAEAQMYEEEYIRLDGTTFPVEATGTRFTMKGKRYGMAIVRDVTARKQAEARLRENEERFRQLAASRQLLLSELNHRVKNHLAALMSLISMMEREQREAPEVFEALRNRLFGMSTVHEMIAAGGWQAVNLAPLIRHILAQFRTTEDREISYCLNGPTIAIAPSQAGPIAMIVQELVINSRKYGALSTIDGHIDVSWCDPPTEETASGRSGPVIVLTWKERGGPAPVKQTPSGLGMRLIEGFSRFELNGESTFRFDPDGLECEIRIRKVVSKPSANDTGQQPDARGTDPDVGTLADFV